MSSWVYLFSKFTTEALLLEILCICSVCAAYAAFWINRKRRLGAVQDAVPSNLVKTYLNELISQANTIRQQLFGLLADAGVQVPAAGGIQGDQLAEALRLLQGQLAKAPAPAVAPAPVVSVISQDPELKGKMAALEAKLSEQAKNLEAVIIEKERLLRDLEQTRAAVSAGSPLAASTAGSDNSGELMKKIQVLEDKLAEYSVIEDDLANLKKLQQENAQLRAALGGKAPIPPPAETAPAAQPAASTPPPAAASVVQPTAAAFEKIVDKVEQNIAQPVTPAAIPAQAVVPPAAAAAPSPAAGAAPPATASTPEAAPANIQKSDEDLLSEFEKMLDS